MDFNVFFKKESSSSMPFFVFFNIRVGFREDRDEMATGLRLAEATGWPLRAKIKKKDAVSLNTHRAEATKRKINGNVAAIDFGSTYCSIAYTIEGTDDIYSLALNEYYPRVPTAILLYREKDDDDKRIGVSIKSFGYNAQENYQTIKAADRSKVIYFERMKMNLQHDQVT